MLLDVRQNRRPREVPKVLQVLTTRVSDNVTHAGLTLGMIDMGCLLRFAVATGAVLTNLAAAGIAAMAPGLQGVRMG